MKLKTAVVLVGIACVFGAAHYNDHLTVSVTLPSPAEVVDAVGKVADELKESSDDTGISVEFSGDSHNFASMNNENAEEVYRVRPAWDDYENQIGAYNELENAIYNCPVGYYVFNDAGEIVYDPNSY